MEATLIGLVAERFQIAREVGRGAAGIVYKAHDAVSKVDVALKVIASTGADLVEQARFTREGQMLSELSDPGIVRVIAFGALEASCIDGSGRRLEEGSPFIAMEWLEGRGSPGAAEARPARSSIGARGRAAGGDGARRRARRGDRAPRHQAVEHLSPRRSLARRAALGVFDAGSGEPLGAAAQVLRIKLVDFGVAASNDVRLTHSGAVVGTPAYMAPEQARGDGNTDVRSDIYSLGATLFELIAGRPPHIGPTSIATLARLVTTPAPRLSDLLLDVPPALDDLIQRMLSSNQDERPSSALDVATSLALLGQDALPGLSPAAPKPDASAGTRLVTTLVALHVATGEDRAREIERLREQGADALPSRRRLHRRAPRRAARLRRRGRARARDRALALAPRRARRRGHGADARRGHPLGRAGRRPGRGARARGRRRAPAHRRHDDGARPRRFQFEVLPRGAAAVVGAARAGATPG